MLRQDQADQLLSMGKISKDQYDRLTVPTGVPTDTELASLPETTPELRTKWDAENAVAQDKADAIAAASHGVMSNKMGISPVAMNPDLAKPTSRMDIINKAKEMAMNKKLAAEGQPAVPSESDTEVQARDAGLPYDASKISNPNGLVPTEQQASAAAGAKTVDPLTGLDNAFNQEKQANLDSAKHGKDQADAEAKYIGTMAQHAQEMEIANQEREKARQTQMDTEMGKLNESVDKFSKMPATTGQLFASKSTGGKLLAGIALFLGSAANGSTQNSAVQAMQTAVDSDLAKQKANVDEKRGIYHEMLNKFGDERAADAAAKISYLQNAQLQLNAISSKYKGQQVADNAKMLNAKIEQQKQALHVEFQKAVGPKIASADAVTNAIYTQLPKEQREAALKEKGILDEKNNTMQAIDKTYDDLDKVGFIAGNTPKTDARTSLQAGNSFIATTIQKVAKGRLNETSLREVIRPYQVEPSDSKSERQIKRQKFKDFVTANTDPTPLLSSLNVSSTDSQPIPGAKKYK